MNVADGNLVEKVLEIVGDGVDYAFDCIGKGEVQSATVAALRVGGKATWVGVAPIHQKSVELNAWDMTLFQKSISGTCYGGASPFELAPKLLDMYRAGLIQVEELITAESSHCGSGTPTCTGSGWSTASASHSLASSSPSALGVMTSVRCPMVRWNRNGCAGLVTRSCLS